MQKNVVFYAITRIGTSDEYIGSSISLKARWKQHRYTLNKGTHHSAALQRAWVQYGQESFSFEIIEIRDCIDVNERATIELQWIIKRGTYNAMSDHVDTHNMGTSNAEREMFSAIHKAKAANDPKYAAFLVERGEAISAYMKSPEGRANMAQHSKRRWQDPEERKRLRAGINRWIEDPAAQAIHAEKGRIRESDPDRVAVHAARTKALWNDPIVGAKYREAGKIRWANPNAKAHQAQKMREYHAKRKAAKIAEPS